MLNHRLRNMRTGVSDGSQLKAQTIDQPTRDREA
jgi:hypothetical protein